MNHEVISWDTEPPSNLDILVGMVRKTADEQASGWLQSVTIRMPMTLACFLEALAKHSGHSRNKIMVKALEASLDAVLEQLPEEERAEIHQICADLVGERLKDKNHESGEI